MGNVSTGASTGTSAKKINLDEVDFKAIDNSKSLNKELKQTRKSKEYQLLRAAARQGIPANKRVQLWLTATNASNKYMAMYDEICAELFTGIAMLDFPQFPMFGSGCEFTRTEEAQKFAAQRILLVLAIEHDTLKYCPQIGYLVELMITYVDEKSVFAICHSMVVASKHNNWYFKTDYFNAYVRIQTFMSIFEDNVKLVASWLKSQSMDISNILGDAISSMFVEYLSEATYMRLIDIFTVEGYKVLFRCGVALLNYAQADIMRSISLKTLKKMLIAKSKTLLPSELCQRCFAIYLTRNKFQKLDLFHRQKTIIKDEPEEETYVRRWPTFNPEILDSSKILSNKTDFMQLWVWLPPGCHIGDYSLLFSTETHGYKLQSMYDECMQRENLIIIIQSTKNEIFGCFVKTLGEQLPSQKLIRDPKIFAFMMKSNNPEIGKRCFEPKTGDHYYHEADMLTNMHTFREAVVQDNYVAVTVDTHGDPDTVSASNLMGIQSMGIAVEQKSDDTNNHTDHNNNNGNNSGDHNNNNNNNNNNNVDRFNTTDTGKAIIPVLFPAKDSFSVGGEGDVNVLWFDADMNHGLTYASQTFSAPQLSNGGNGEFSIKYLEVWSVDEGGFDE